MSFCVLTVLAISGVAFFTENEGWSAVEASYWTLCTMTVRVTFAVSALPEDFMCAVHTTLVLLPICILDGGLRRSAPREVLI
jgi:hypothetical protein